ncbi:TatD family hydrolase [Occultella kanbiaonis]|uniref:TatD family hydrolase n=1 Tax=Occultella kanbiaonis TaxID=2675754 RepID=UPI0012B99747|nr:TatD family hydrolase [Occultella kanbiaonis]
MPCNLPPLDAHAHIAGDVTQAQLDALGGAVVFAMTRSVNEARYALRPAGAVAANVVWAIGVHPGVPVSLAQHSPEAFAGELDRFALAGEVGLAGRSSETQTNVFRSVLESAADHPVLVSVHSAGARTEVLDEIARHSLPGVVLHWFNGTQAEFDRAIELGCWFSVNAAMSDATLRMVPPDRLLTETDFPAARRKTLAARPGDVREIESRLVALGRTDVRTQVWRNLASLVEEAGVMTKLPSAVQQVIHSATQG